MEESKPPKKPIEKETTPKTPKEEVEAFVAEFGLSPLMPSEFEGLPISLLESMACGCIPITTDVGESGSVIKHRVTGFLMGNNKAEDIINTLGIAEKEDLDLISKNCVKTIKENYDLNILTEKFIEIYDNFKK